MPGRALLQNPESIVGDSESKLDWGWVFDRQISGDAGMPMCLGVRARRSDARHGGNVATVNFSVRHILHGALVSRDLP